VAQFVSQAILPCGQGYVTPGAGGEPPLPAAFAWGERVLDVRAVLRVWRSAKDDRGDTYLKRHWFEFETAGGARAVVYFERQAKRNAPRWWLFSIDEG